MLPKPIACLALALSLTTGCQGPASAPHTAASPAPVEALLAMPAEAPLTLASGGERVIMPSAGAPVEVVAVYDRGVEETVRWEGQGGAVLRNRYGQVVYQVREGAPVRVNVPAGSYTLTVTGGGDGAVMLHSAVDATAALRAFSALGLPEPQRSEEDCPEQIVAAEAHRVAVAEFDALGRRYNAEPRMYASAKARIQQELEKAAERLKRNEADLERAMTEPQLSRAQESYRDAQRDYDQFQRLLEANEASYTAEEKAIAAAYTKAYDEVVRTARAEWAARSDCDLARRKRAIPDHLNPDLYWY